MLHEDFSDVSTDVSERDVDSVREAESNRELLDRQVRQQLESFAAQNRQRAQDIQLRMLQTGEILFGNIDRYTEAIARYNRNADIYQAASSAENPREYLQNAFRRYEVQDRDRTQRNANTNRWLAVALGLVGLATILTPVLITLLGRRAEDQPTSDIKLFPEDDAKDQDTKKMVFEHHDNWMNQADKDYWVTTMASISDAEIPVTQKHPTLGDHLLYLNYTKTIARLEAPFIWENGDDYMGLINELTSAFDVHDPSHFSTLYQKLATLTYQGQPLPRAIAADVMQSALAVISQTYSS